MRTLIRNIKGLVHAEEGAGRNQVAGSDMAKLPVLENAWLLLEGDRIAGFGRMESCPEVEGQTIDAEGRFVFPSFVDSHTHLVFAGSREHEFVMRIQGKSYEEIAAEGGGILNSAKRLQGTSEEDLLAAAEKRLQEVIRLGTGAIEIKSGYGLTTEAELKILRVIRELKKRSPIPIKATFLGAHAFPLQYKNDHAGYLREIVEEMLPAVTKEGLADYMDVFCDKGFFNPEESEQLLEAGKRYGLKPRLHANELDYSGGIQVAVKHKALSVDHLEFTGEEEIEALRNGTTMPTLLPGTAFFLRLPYPPARKMIDAGLPVALASDYNPGTCPSGNMSFVMSLACTQLRMLPEEVINAATLNSARALELENDLGTIRIGKKANLFITEPMTSYSFLPYSFGRPAIETIILNGKIYWTNTLS